MTLQIQKTIEIIIVKSHKSLVKNHHLLLPVFVL